MSIINKRIDKSVQTGVLSKQSETSEEKKYTKLSKKTQETNTNESNKKDVICKVVAVLIVSFAASILVGLGVLGLTFIPGRGSIVDLIKTKKGIILFRILVPPLAGGGSFVVINIGVCYSVFLK